VPVHPRTALLDGKPVPVGAPCATPQPVTGLQQQRPQPSQRALAGDGDPGETAADDDDVIALGHPEVCKRTAVESGTDVVGREAEVAALAEFLDARARLPGVLLLQGEAGIGKTTLWRHGVGLAAERGYRVLSCSGSSSEAQLSFVALGDLLGEALQEVLPALPAPQAKGLAVALLVEEAQGSSQDQRAIALAFVGALRLLAGSQPVAVAIDDIQWLDRPSAVVLEFALRRLAGESVAFLLTRRQEEESALAPLDLERAVGEERLALLPVGPLSLGALHRLLSDRLDVVLSRPKLRRLRELSGGNPLFALELGRALQRGAIRLEAVEPLPGTLASVVRDRLRLLPPDTRVALRAASALAHPTLELVGNAIGGGAAERLTPAIEGHVVELDREHIRFTHPLLASGIYTEAPMAERRALHRRLAELLPDSEERARHLALGTERPDGEVASALERAAGQAHDRGALPAAAELSELARRLTPAELDESRHRRTVDAANFAWEAGETERGRQLLNEARSTAPPGNRRAEILGWLGNLEEYEGDRRKAVELYREARDNATGDPRLRSRSEEGLASALLLLRRDLPAAAEHARAAVTYAEEAGDRTMEIAALQQLVLVDALTGGREWRAAVARGRELERHTGPVQTAVSATFALAVVLTWVDEFPQACEHLLSLRDQSEERAEESALPWTLAQLCWAEFLAGRWDEADRHAQEAIEMAVQADQEPQRLVALGVRGLVRAARGDVDEARADTETTLALAPEHGVMFATIVGACGLGLLELSLERFDAVDHLLGPLGNQLEENGVREPGSVRFVPDHIEALIALGRLDEAESLLETLERQATAVDRASALAAAGRCRGLVAAARGDLQGALAALETALVEHGRVSTPFEEARTRLALGVTRRRARMKRPAREVLEQALASFEQLGARLWADKARADLARIGGRPATTGELTATESRIAALAAEGRSNKEIAAALYVTPKTVETHLSRIYRKVGVRSRTQLARQLSADAEAPKL
jgi:DNA-binding CsgD family transcriptional regulator